MFVNKCTVCIFSCIHTQTNHEIHTNSTYKYVCVITNTVCTYMNVIWLCNMLHDTCLQVCYQLKILTTALFSVLLLRKRLSQLKWLALLLLTIGVALTQLPKQSTATATATAATIEQQQQYKLLGLFAVLLASVTSGFSGVYFEKILKGSTTSLWMRNVQMGCTSVLFAFMSVLVKDGGDVMHNGFFYGYGGVVCGVVCLQVLYCTCVCVSESYIVVLCVRVCSICICLLAFLLLLILLLSYYCCCCYYYCCNIMKGIGRIGGGCGCQICRQYSKGFCCGRLYHLLCHL